MPFLFFDLARELRDLIYIEALTEIKLDNDRTPFQKLIHNAAPRSCLLVNKQFHKECLEQASKHVHLTVSISQYPTFGSTSLPSFATHITTLHLNITCPVKRLENYPLKRHEGWVGPLMSQLPTLQTVSMEIAMSSQIILDFFFGDSGETLYGAEEKLEFFEHWDFWTGIKGVEVIELRSQDGARWFGREQGKPGRSVEWRRGKGWVLTTVDEEENVARKQEGGGFCF